MREAFEKGRSEGMRMKLALPSIKLRGSSGDKLGASTGSSLEFQDYREYRPGDDLRRLDWAAYARSDKLTLRLYREEIQPRVEILSDFSLSMTAPRKDKIKHAAALAGLLGEASFKAGCSLAWWSFGNGWKRICPVSNSFPEHFQIPQPDGGFSLEDEFARISPALSKNGVRICISDFMWECDPAAVIRKTGEGAAALYMIALLTEEELDPPLYGTVALTEPESGRKVDMMVGPAEKHAYLKRLNEHLELWQSEAASCGVNFAIMKAVHGRPVPDPEALVDADFLEWI